jgi:SPP1 gp7 family putative phage head morphogenesis protein
MCVAFDERLLAVHEALRVSEEVLERTNVRKALDLATPRGFDRAVALLAARLRRVTAGSNGDAVRAVLDVLDVDWQRTTPEQRRRLVGEALNAAGRHTALVPERIRVPLEGMAAEVVEATRSHARRSQGLGIAARMNELDRRVTEHVVRSETNFVRDAYGNRLADFGARARALVGEGVERGLGREEIAASLREAATAALVDRHPFYWETVASSFVGTGRSLAQMSAFAEAGVEEYVIEAVLDERTTAACRFLHGKRFSVRRALERFDFLERLDDPEDVKRVAPWVREGTEKSGARVLYVGRGEARTPVAEIVRSAVGQRDAVGEFRALATDARLSELGIGFPPYHGLCRTTVLAVL